MAVFVVWRNYLKGRKERIRCSPPPTQTRGTLDHRIGVTELLERRLFISRVELPERWAEYNAEARSVSRPGFLATDVANTNQS
jgi:hypothetical protein